MIEQLSFLPQLNNDNKTKTPTSISERLKGDFSIESFAFFDLQYREIYRILKKIVPKEDVRFDHFGTETLIACELICAAICHQMNWDYLRQAIYEKTVITPQWLTSEHLKEITTRDVQYMFDGYNKPERIRAAERANILRSIGTMISNFGNYTQLIYSNTLFQNSYTVVRKNLLTFHAFSRDPGEKKLQLFIQKLSTYSEFEYLGDACKPAIDYHLIRCYIRRGLIYPTTKYAKNYIFASNTVRKEHTVAALRDLCGNVIQQICSVTSLNNNTVNTIEWWVGRSICVQNQPDCQLLNKESYWLKPHFQRCPFYNNCYAINYDNDYLNLNEPLYQGMSY